jgi:hypothetical protein
VAADSVSVQIAAGLARQRIAQASQAKQCRGQARPKNHNKRFPQYQATQAGTFEKISCQLQAGQKAAQAGTFEKISCQLQAGQKAAQASQANGAVGLAGLQNQDKQFLVIHSDRVFSSERVAFFRKKTFNTSTQRRISRRAFWLIWKNS